MQAVYFAYGSNLLTARMQERVPSAMPRGPAWLANHRLTTDKRGQDGTGKANLQPTPGERVWGVVWSLDAADWGRLDACENGYRRLALQVVGKKGEQIRAETYISNRLTDDPVLDSEYKRCLVDGARAHRLPEDWVSLLEALPERNTAAGRLT